MSWFLSHFWSTVLLDILILVDSFFKHFDYIFWPPKFLMRNLQIISLKIAVTYHLLLSSFFFFFNYVSWCRSLQINFTWNSLSFLDDYMHTSFFRFRKFQPYFFKYSLCFFLFSFWVSHYNEYLGPFDGVQQALSAFLQYFLFLFLSFDNFHSLIFRFLIHSSSCQVCLWILLVNFHFTLLYSSAPRNLFWLIFRLSISLLIFTFCSSPFSWLSPYPPLVLLASLGLLF